MKKESITTLMKWGTVVILALSAVFFFLPYYSTYGYKETIITAIQGARSGDMIEIIGRFILPAGLTVLAAFFMALRYSTVKCIISVILCVIASFLYLSFLSNYSGKMGIGLIGNIIIAIAGVVLPIVNIVFRKMVAKKITTQV